MKKQSQCYKAIHKEYENIDTKIVEVICTSCGRPCTLEDVPSKGWEERFDGEFIHVYNDYTEFDKHTYWDIKDFIKSEREVWKRELVEKVKKYKEDTQGYGTSWTFDKTTDEIINKIQEK